MELFDFAKLIKGNIQFSGSYEKGAVGNGWVNAYLHVGYNAVTARRRGLSCFGRSINVDLDEALFNLAGMLSEQKVFADDGLEYQAPKLVHTKGYRG